MQAYVYKSRRNADTYVFLAAREGFERMPDAVRARLGDLDFILELTLDAGRRLAQSDPERVRANLLAHGFHVQFPPPVIGAVAGDD